MCKISIRTEEGIFVSDLYLLYNVRSFSSPLLIVVFCFLGALAVKNTHLHSSGVLTRILERFLNAHCTEQVNGSQPAGFH